MAELLVQASREAGCASVVEYFFRQIPVPTYQPQKSLPGKYRGMAVTMVEERKGSKEESTVWLQNCGGVSMDIRADLTRNRIVDPVAVYSQWRGKSKYGA